MSAVKAINTKRYMALQTEGVDAPTSYYKHWPPDGGQQRKVHLPSRGRQRQQVYNSGSAVLALSNQTIASTRGRDVPDRLGVCGAHCARGVSQFREQKLFARN